MVRYTVFKETYQKRWSQCLPFRSQSDFTECTECYNLKQAIKEEKAGFIPDNYVKNNMSSI